MKWLLLLVMITNHPDEFQLSQRVEQFEHKLPCVTRLEHFRIANTHTVLAKGDFYISGVCVKVLD